MEARAPLAVEAVPAPPLAAAEPPRLGLIALATDLTFERDAARLLPPDEAALHATRIAFENPTTPERLRATAPRLGEAAALLAPGVRLRAIAYACTSASVAIGVAEVEAAIGRGRPGVPVVTPVSAALQAFAALGVGRIALLTPYLARTAEPMAAFFEDAGVSVARAVCFGMEDDRAMARLDPDGLARAVAALDARGAEAVFVACTALPALGVAARVEAETGRPVVTANGATLWAMRRLAGLDGAPRGFGRLQAEPLPEGAFA